MHLVDHARAYVEEHYRRPAGERLVRALLAATLPHPRRFRFALRLARLARPLTKLFDRLGPLRALAAMLRLAPARVLPLPVVGTVSVPASRGRVVLQRGCVEPALRPGIAEATERLLGRAGYAVEYAEDEGCCGALVHHLGRAEEARAQARALIDRWIARLDGGAEAIIVTASGCGTVIKDYDFLLRDDPAYAAKAGRIAAATHDLAEFLIERGIPQTVSGREGLTVAWHAPCSLQHGQKLSGAPVALLKQAGCNVRVPAEAHLCCGSAGTYNILQPDLAGQLAERKAGAIARLQADCVVTANIGCAVQIGAALGAPVLHLAELLDWTSGGPAPRDIPAISA
jgi:glycolate oxidase iron-sulfur subunit